MDLKEFCQGVRGGPWDQNFQLFVGPHSGSKMLNFGLYELKTLFSRFFDLLTYFFTRNVP